MEMVYRAGRCTGGRLAYKLRWLTNMLSLFFAGLLFLMITAVWFKGL